MPEAVTLAGSGLVFQNTYGSGVNAAFKAAIITAENFYQSHFTNAVSINMSFDLQAISTLYSGSNDYTALHHVSYSTLVNALTAHRTTADDAAALASLPAADPTNGAGFDVAPGEARLLGLEPAAVSPTIIDDTIVLNSNLPFTFGADAVGVLEHEISEGALGRIGGLGIQNDAWGPVDLFRYSSAGVRDLTGGADGLPTFFSVDGTHLLTQFHNSVNTAGVFDTQDFGDWDKTVGDAFGPGGPGSPGTLTDTDLRLLDILGWTPTANAAPLDDFANSLTDTSHPFGHVSVNGAADGSLETLGDRDWFQVQLVAGQTYVINITGTTLADPYLRLHNSVGTTLVENDDIVAGVNRNSQVTYTATVSGTYYVEAGAFNDAYTGTYHVTVASNGDDFANSFTDRTHPFGQVVVNGVAAGSLEVTGDRDWFQVQLTAGVRYLLNLTGGTLADPYLYLHDSTGATIAQNDDIVAGINRNSQIAFTATTSGTYYLEAGAFQDTYAGTYTVGVGLAADDYAGSLMDTAHHFGQVAINGSATGTLETAGDRDWFRARLEAGVSYTITLNGTSLQNPYLRLRDASGTQLAQNDDVSLANPNSQIVFTPTATGSYFIEAAAFNDVATGSYQVAITGAAPHQSGASVSDDLNGDGKSDVLWQRSDGLIVDWSMNGSSIAGGAIVSSLDSSWKLLGTGDFNGDGKTDLLWQNSNGLIVDWSMNGGTIATGAIVGALDSSWTLLGTGDLDGDGSSDLIWRNTAGLVVDWGMGGSTVLSGTAIGTLDPSWKLLASADFNGDGKADLLWQSAKGSIVEWDQSGASIIGSGTVGALDSSWKFLAAADFNGDGKADMLWQNTAGQIVEWQMNGASVVASAVLGTLDGSWKMLATGDYNGDGKADILWQNSAGVIVDWTMNGTSIAAGAPVSTLDGSWKHIG